MKKYIQPIGVLIIAVLIGVFIYRGKKIEELSKENSQLQSNLETLIENQKNRQEAAVDRDHEYKKIEKDSLELDNKLKEVKNADWLHQTIPADIDATIPY